MKITILTTVKVKPTELFNFGVASKENKNFEFKPFLLCLKKYMYKQFAALNHFNKPNTLIDFCKSVYEEAIDI